MVDDAELLRCYSQDRSEAAFSELVRRHVDVVYAAALRRMGGDTHRARDVTQAVFVILARKAAAVVHHPSLIGWLHRSTRYVAIDLIRKEARRAAREQAAAAAVEADAIPEPQWEQLRPWIDGALDTLGDRDRAAVLLRFFAGHSWSEVGARLGISEDAARKRVEHGLERLKRALAGRGVTSSSAALATALTQIPAIAAPTELASGLAGTALAAAESGSVVAGVSTLSILMSTTKIPLALGAAAVAASVLLTGSVGSMAWQEQRQLTGARDEQAASLTFAQNTVVALQRELATLASSSDSASGLHPASGGARAARSLGQSPSAAGANASTARGRDTSRMGLRAAQMEAFAANPEYRALERRGYRLRAQSDYGAFFTAQQLPPSTVDALKELLVQRSELQATRTLELLKNGPDPEARVTFADDHGSVAVAQVAKPDSPEAALTGKIKALLGDATYAEFQKYERLRLYSRPAENVAVDMRDQQQPLTAMQLTQLKQLFSEMRTYPGVLRGPANEDPTPTADENAIITRAGAFLTSDQSKVLTQHLVDNRVATSIRARVQHAVVDAQAPVAAKGTTP